MIDYDKLIQSIPEGLNKIEIARFLYIELGRYFIYDPEFVSEQDPEKRREIAYRNIDEIKNNKVVCISLSNIYTELLIRCGIDAKTVYDPANPNDPKDIGHAYTKIKIDGKEGSISFIFDLTNIKVGFQTEHFLPELSEEIKRMAVEKGMQDKLKTLLMIDKETLREIDNKIGYTYNRKIFERYYIRIKNKVKYSKKKSKICTIARR